jgi:hypothetical protein
MKYQYIILIFVLFMSCSVQKNNTSQNSKVIKANLYKIELKDSIIIYHIRNEKLDGVFAKERYCKNKVKNQKLLLENKTYKFILEQELVDNHVSIVRDIDYYVAGYLIRKAGTPTIYYVNCLNVCGEYIIKDN